MPPNVLLVVVDDQRPDTVGPFDDGAVATPTLDALAAAGCVLRPYTTVPVCTPGRAELLSGANGFENGCRWFGEPMGDDMTLLPEALSDAGYETFLTGKWHNETDPGTAGFDRVRDLSPGGGERVNDYYEDGHTYRVTVDGATVEGHSTDVITDPAVEYLRSAPGEPWFCTVAYHAPHEPFQPPPAFDRYDPDDVAVPPNFMPEHPFDNGDMTIRDEYTAPWPRTPGTIRERRARYYGMISHVDHSVGRLLSTLERTGHREDTLVAFTSDHGLAVGSHGLLGKENLYEHSARVPLVIGGPGVASRDPPGALCGHYDLFPTLFDLLGLDVPGSVTGGSYAPVLRDDADGHRDHVFGAYRDRMRMARDDRWKLLYYPDAGTVQLFDLHADPHETRNLLADWRPYEPVDFSQSWMPDYEPPADPGTVDRVAADLWNELRTWGGAMDDPVDLPDAVPVTVSP